LKSAGLDSVAIRCSAAQPLTSRKDIPPDA
jgi:hypothetical protein